jgi:hypothetical protein
MYRKLSQYTKIFERIYISIYIYRHMYIHVFIHRHMYIHVFTYMYTYKYMYIFTICKDETPLHVYNMSPLVTGLQPRL